MSELKDFLVKNKFFVFIFVIFLSFIWIGNLFKTHREAKIQALLQDSAPKQNPQPAANLNANVTDVQDPHVLSDTYDATGKHTVLISKKTKSELEAEKKVFENSSVEVERILTNLERDAKSEVLAEARTKFKSADIENQITQISNQENISNTGRSNEYIELRNRIFLSGTDAAQKKKLLDEIDVKINSIALEQQDGFDSQPGPNGEVILTPKFKTQKK